MGTISAAKLAANQRNAQQSSGPKTLEGKARSRANAVKHGLTGAGIALPGEDAAMVEARFLDLQEQMAPDGIEGALLVRQMALSSLRIDRAAQQETAALARLARHAATEFDLAHAAEVERLFDTIEDNPSEHHRRLLTSTAGIDLIDRTLDAIRDQVESGAYRLWQDTHRSQIEALFGGTFGAFPVARVGALLLALSGDFLFIPPREWAGIAEEARPEWAATALMERIDTERARLLAIRAAIDPTILSADRQEAARHALFDPPPALVLARKYEATAHRTFQRSQRDFHNLGLAEPSTIDPIADPLIAHDQSSTPLMAPIPDQGANEPSEQLDESDDSTTDSNETTTPTTEICSNEPTVLQPVVVDPRLLYYLNHPESCPTLQPTPR